MSRSVLALWLALCFAPACDAQAPDSTRVFTSVHTDSSKLYFTKWKHDTTVVHDTLPPAPPQPPVVGCDTAKTSLQFLAQFDGPKPWYKISQNEGDVTPHSHTQETAVVHECAASVKFDLRKSDPMEGGTSGKWRTELKLLVDSANGGIPVAPGKSVVGKLGDEVWIGWSIYVPADFVFETAGNTQETVSQAKSPSGRSPTWELQIEKGTWKSISRWGLADPPPHADTLAAIRRGTWSDFVLHAIWKADNTGVLELWLNGAKIMDRHNVPTAYADWDAQGIHYWKFGIYKWSWKPTGDASIVTQRVLYFDAVRATDGAHGSYNVVAPR